MVYKCPLKWIFGHCFCILSAAFRYVCFYSSWLSLAMIAICRCIFVINPNLSDRIFSKFKGKLVTICIWITSIVFISPILFSVIGEFGWDCNRARCGLIARNENDSHSIRLFFMIRYLTPTSLIVFSYIIVWFALFYNKRTLSE